MGCGDLTHKKKKIKRIIIIMTAINDRPDRLEKQYSDRGTISKEPSLQPNM